MTNPGLPKELKFHCLRHSFATHVLQKGADIYGVSKIMGHPTLIVTAEFYDHCTALNYRGVTDLL
jgi:site-specific recombinase XerD